MMIITVDTDKESAEGLRRAAKLLQEIASFKEGGDIAQEIEEVEEVAQAISAPPVQQEKQVPEIPKKPSLPGGLQVY